VLLGVLFSETIRLDLGLLLMMVVNSLLCYSKVVFMRFFDED
jgi:hypothetical protein